MGVVLFVPLIFPSIACPQSIKGHVADQETHKGIASATIVLAAKFPYQPTTVSDQNGMFYLAGIRKGIYDLQVTAEGYCGFHSSITIDSAGINIGTIFLQIRRDSLTPAVVNAPMPTPQIHGDTMSYNTAHILVKENSVVSDLLSKLPGFQINSDGSITVGGKKVEKLLVDGEDIFANTPGAVVKNLNADMIERIEVLDKKSPQAEFSGIDDGTLNKTVNLVLKDNSRHSSSLKMQGGGNITGLFEGSGSLARFKSKEQLFVLGMAANTGNTQVNSTVGDYSAGLNLYPSLNDPLGGSAGAGIPSVQGTGGHYSNAWVGHELHINANGQVENLSTQPMSTAIIRQILPDSIYLQKLSSRSLNSIRQQQVNFVLEDRLSKRSDLQCYGQGSQSNGTNSFAANETNIINDNPVNTSYRTINDEVSIHDFAIDTRWREHLKKPEETFSIGLSISESKSSASGFLESIQQFTGALPSSSDSIDQYKKLSNGTVTVSGSVDYLHPFRKWLNLSTSYNISSSSNSSQIETIGKSGDHYSNYIDSLSSNYNNTYLDQRLSIGCQGQTKVLFYSFGLDGHSYSFTVKSAQQEELVDNRYRYLAPRAFFRYGFNSHDQLVLYYGSSFQAPAPNQLQPVQNNADPLHTTSGNPLLKPSIGQHVSLNWYRTIPYYLVFNLFYGTTASDISTKTAVDSLGRQSSQPVNVPGSSNIGNNLYLSKILRPFGVEFGVTEAATISQNHTFVNQVLSSNHQLTASFGFFSRKSSAGRYEFDVRVNVGFSANRSSINGAANTNLWQQNEYFHGSFYLSPTFEILAVCNYTWRQNLTNIDGRNSTTVCGIGCKRYFVHNRLVITWQLDDLLNQNTGLSRSVSGTQISETTSNALGRHWMLLVSYQFTNRKK